MSTPLSRQLREGFTHYLGWYLVWPEKSPHRTAHADDKTAVRHEHTVYMFIVLGVRYPGMRNAMCVTPLEVQT